MLPMGSTTRSRYFAVSSNSTLIRTGRHHGIDRTEGEKAKPKKFVTNLDLLTHAEWWECCAIVDCTCAHTDSLVRHTSRHEHGGVPVKNPTVHLSFIGCPFHHRGQYTAQRAALRLLSAQLCDLGFAQGFCVWCGRSRCVQVRRHA